MSTETQTMEQQSLYEEHKKIYPRHITGTFRTVKWAVTAFLMAFFFITPWLRWHGRQAILFDIPERKFHLFGVTFWPQEVIYLVVVLVIAAIILFLITALLGRVLCGYVCWQTVWTDIFLWVERFIEGSPYQRISLDKGPLTAAKAVKKGVKHVVWLAISVATGISFTSYFSEAGPLWMSFLTGHPSTAAFMTLLIVGGTTYVFAGWAREQVCIYMCPYARFQGAMFDQDTLIVAYDEKRGEARGAKRAATAEAKGDCIDCRLCVQVCPMGIDIRDGQQYQCITCALCVDACNSVMKKMGRPKDLIGYTAFSSQAGGRTRIVRPRVIVYSAIILVLTAGMLWHMAGREHFDLKVIKERQPLFAMMSDGSIQNKFTIKVANMTAEEQTYKVSIEGLKNASLVVSEDRLRVRAGQVTPYIVFVRQGAADMAGAGQKFRFVLVDVNNPNNRQEYTSAFFGPAGK